MTPEDILSQMEDLRPLLNSAYGKEASKVMCDSLKEEGYSVLRVSISKYHSKISLLCTSSKIRNATTAIGFQRLSLALCSI